jgi:DNA-binding MarR family transcriptional regulator
MAGGVPDTSGAPDLTPVLASDPLDLRVSLAAIVHWADSHEVRVRLMRDVGFVVDDLPMFLVVNQLAHRGAMRPTDLALVLGTGKANLSKIAHRLTAAGLVRRVRASDDERSVLLALSPAGREIGRRIMAHAQQTMDAALADWSPEDLATLRRLLARLARDTVGWSGPGPGTSARSTPG